MHRAHWGPWRLRAPSAELWLPEPGRPDRELYAVDLDRCGTPADALDWIFQVNRKGWADPTVMAGLLAALHDVLRPQVNLCRDGRPTTLTRADIRRLIATVVATAKEQQR